MKQHDPQDRSGDFTTSRRGPVADDIAFIAAKAAAGVPWQAIAAMVGRPITDVRAAFDAFEARPTGDRPMPAPPPASAYVKGRSKVVPSRPMPNRVAEIAARIAGDYGCTVAELTGSRGSEAAQLARQAAYHALRSLKLDNGRRRFSLAQIGGYFGGRDHTTVLHGARAHARRMAELSARIAA